MDTSRCWDASASDTFRAPATVLALALLITLVVSLAGCRRDPTNPFLADADDPRAEDVTPAPLADSLARLKQRGREFHDAAAQAQDAAHGLGDDARDAAHQARAEVQASATEALNQAETAGRQIAADAGAQVQMGAVDSLEELPLEQAGPLLLVAISRGTPVTQRAAAEQLARRWPPAAGYAAELNGAGRQQALAELRGRWIQQYGHIDEAAAAAQAQAARVVDAAGQVVDNATAAVQSADAQINDMRQVVASLHDANLPGAARQRLAMAIEQAAADSNADVRAQAAAAMGEVGDPVFLPTLVSLLGDDPDVQDVALASLPRVTGRDVTAGNDRALSNDERARLWQLWYHEQQGAAGVDPEKQ